ncbi:uncharacterized protein involved in response to NO [Albidovulum inexpectatum]|uniref:Uncharacterized protein involved in response to NO n=1 Tax=Albidovulum inexpectatum TaxID=196587 RepID=A0A2S5JF31_9RHOB|nr:NnrS family protein [Albidovulum inexpectatum]PPB79968.1 uncharacterized protein involved in response to NO [Albidovulum inexpectatum]
MTSSAERMRAWAVPALLSYGFRPFFLGAGLWATLSMVIWITMLGGLDPLPIAMAPVEWHAHAFLFGFLGAVMAGFMLTAVPNWTGRLPITGWPLAGLVALWGLGRVAMAVSGHLPMGMVAVAELSMPAVLALVIAREIVAGRNWRNLVILVLLAVFALGDGLFLWEAAQHGYAQGGVGLRLGLAAAVMMIGIIGGRIVPSFTRNWLAAQGAAAMPAAPMQVFDRIALAGLLLALAAWTAAPEHVLTGMLLLVAGALHLIRLARWRGHATLAEPLVTVLHVGYCFVPLGALGMGAEILLPGTLGMAAAQHLWMAGAVGLMSMAVMTRAALGHTGRALHASGGIATLYGALILSVAARVLAGAWPGEVWLLHLSAAGWIGAWGGFVAIYWPILTRPRLARKAPSGARPAA